MSSPGEQMGAGAENTPTTASFLAACACMFSLHACYSQMDCYTCFLSFASCVEEGDWEELGESLSKKLFRKHNCCIYSYQEEMRSCHWRDVVLKINSYEIMKQKEKKNLHEGQDPSNSWLEQWRLLRTNRSSQSHCQDGYGHLDEKWAWQQPDIQTAKTAAPQVTHASVWLDSEAWTSGVEYS